MMKKIALVLFLMLNLHSISAQELNWYTDVNEAIKESDKVKKPMLMFFTGSDWCGWCIRLQNEVLKTPEFGKWAKENVVLVELDYPRRVAQTPEVKNQNSQLQQAFRIQGFPTIFFVDVTISDGHANFKGLGKTGYVAGGPKNWIETANKILSENK